MIASDRVLGLALLAEEQPGFVRVLTRLAPDQAGALWIGVLVTLLVAFDFRRFFSLRNVLVLLLLLPALPLVDIMNWGIAAENGDSASGTLLRYAFLALFPLTGVMALTGLVLAYRRRDQGPWTFNPGRRALVTLFSVLLGLNGIVGLARAGEDAGPYTSLGALRWSETGIMPYGDPALRGTNTKAGEEARKTPGHGAAATYGPLLYVAHLPFHALTGTTKNAPDLDPMDEARYRRPKDLATRLTCLALHVVLVFALLGAGTRLAGLDVGLALGCLYMASPYVLGLGSDPYLICGLAFISHVAPTAALMVAVAFLHRPVLAGIALAVGAGFLFWPAFLAPLFLGLYAGRRRGVLPFLGGFGLAGAGIVALVLLNMPRELDGKGPIKLFLESTVEHQEGIGPDAYGKSHFSFWHPYDGAKAWWQTPLVGTSSTTKPTFLAFVALCLIAFLLARRRSDTQFCGLVALLAAAIQLWKTHAGGTYVEWYLPFLLLALAATPKPPPLPAAIPDPRA